MVSFKSCLQRAVFCNSPLGQNANLGGAACAASGASQAALNGQPIIQSPSVSILAPGGVVGSTVKIRVTASIPMFLPVGNPIGLDKLTTVQAEATFRQEGW